MEENINLDLLASFKRLHLPADIEITADLITKLIEYNEQKRVPRYNLLDEYYKGRTAITGRVKPEDKANNKLNHDFAGYITDTNVGMFIGNPVRYSVSEEKQESMNKIQSNFNHNDEQQENHKLAKLQSKLGVGYQLVYSNEENHIKFNTIHPKHIVYVWDDKVDSEPLFAIYYTRQVDLNDLDNEEGLLNVKVYTRDGIETWTEDNKGLHLELEEPNLFDNRVQVVECANNEEYIGDYEKQISLIDAYNKSRSDTSNDFEEFTNAYLLLWGMSGATAEDIKQIKRDGVLLPRDANSQGAKWVTKDVNHNALYGHIDRLVSDIHKFAKVPDMSDEQFAGNSSGVAMSYKLLAMKQNLAGKEREFKKTLQDRLDLIIFAEKALGNVDKDFAYRDVTITFNYNMPINVKENVEMVNILSGLVSESTWLSELYCVDNPNEEIKKKEAELEVYNILDEMEKLN